MTPAQTKYLATARAGLCAHCRKAPRTRGVVCQKCWRRNTARNRRPRAGVRRKKCYKCWGLGHYAKTCEKA